MFAWRQYAIYYLLRHEYTFYDLLCTLGIFLIRLLFIAELHE